MSFAACPEFGAGYTTVYSCYRNLRAHAGNCSSFSRVGCKVQSTVQVWKLSTQAETKSLKGALQESPVSRSGALV